MRGEYVLLFLNYLSIYYLFCLIGFNETSFYCEIIYVIKCWLLIIWDILMQENFLAC